MLWYGYGTMSRVVNGSVSDKISTGIDLTRTNMFTFYPLSKLVLMSWYGFFNCLFYSGLINIFYVKFSLHAWRLFPSSRVCIKPDLTLWPFPPPIKGTSHSLGTMCWGVRGSASLNHIHAWLGVFCTNSRPMDQVIGSNKYPKLKFVWVSIFTANKNLVSMFGSSM